MFRNYTEALQNIKKMNDQELSNFIKKYETATLTAAELLTKFEDTAMTYIGYPSREAASKGLLAYAGGKIRRELDDLKQQLNQIGSMFPGYTPPPRAESSAADKDEELFATIERVGSDYENIYKKQQVNSKYLRMAKTVEGDRKIMAAYTLGHQK